MDTASLIETDGHLILNLYLDQEEPHDYWGGQLAAMVQARAELAAGDLRLLYLAWLLALQSDEVDDEEAEPPVPAGLGNLSAGLKAVVDFFKIDKDLIAVAAASSPSIQKPEGMAGWITSLPAEQKNTMLAQVGAGEGAQVQALLLRRFRAASGSPSAASSRTAARAAAYAKHLDELATKTEAAWEKAAELIETKRPRDYDLAVSLLRDLQALAERQGDPAMFRKRFLDLRAQHQRKPSPLERFDQARLPG